MADVTTPALNNIPGHPFPVLANPGLETAAIAAGEQTARARDHLTGVLGTTPDVTVKVLAPDAWEAHATFPLYGMPHFADEHTLVIAGEENEFWRSITPPLAELPAAQLARIRAVYSSPNEQPRLAPFFDLLAVHELAHLFHLQAGRDFPRLWLQELFSNLSLHSYVAAVEPGLLPILVTFPAVVVELGHERFAYHTLDDFERLYVDVGPVNYGWYQCHLHAAAKRLHDLGGDELLRRFWDELPGLGKDRTDGDLAMKLAAVHPALADLAATWPPKPEGAR
jgi:hypothetical protein